MPPPLAEPVSLGRRQFQLILPGLLAGAYCLCTITFRFGLSVRGRSLLENSRAPAPSAKTRLIRGPQFAPQPQTAKFPKPLADALICCKPLKLLLLYGVIGGPSPAWGARGPGFKSRGPVKPHKSHRPRPTPTSTGIPFGGRFGPFLAAALRFGLLKRAICQLRILPVHSSTFNSATGIALSVGWTTIQPFSVGRGQTPIDCTTALVSMLLLRCRWPVKQSHEIRLADRFLVASSFAVLR